MGSFKSSLESLSSSLNLSWRNGDFIEWIIDGISESKGIFAAESTIKRAIKILEGSFPSDILTNHGHGDSEIIYLKISLYMAYFASVKHGWQPIKRALLGLKVQDQRSIEKMFSLILEEKWEDPLFNELQELDLMEVSTPLPCPTTPINRFRKMKTRSSPSTFHFSPTSSTHFPLKDFFTSPVTAQISKYQKIAEEKTKLLRATRLELDHEKLETFNLAREREELIKERKTLRKSLDTTRANLYSKQLSDKNEGDPELSSDLLQKRHSEKKDYENRIVGLEEQLRDAIDERNELINKVENQHSKLQERSIINTKLESRVVELQASLHSEKELNRDMVGKCEDLEAQVFELGEILESRRSTLDNMNQPPNIFANTNGSSWSIFPSASIGDISIDDHLVSMGSLPLPQGENMAETLVIPQLQEKLSITTEQLDDYKFRFMKLEEDYHAERDEYERLQIQLVSANQSNREHKVSLEKLSQVNEELKIESQSVQKCYEEILVERDSLSRSQVQLNHQILKLNEELSAEKAECVNIKAQLTSANQSINEYKASLEKLSKVNEELETESQRVRKSYEEILAERDSLSKSQVQLNHQVVKLKEEQIAEKAECVNIKAQLTHANQSVNENKASLEKLSKVNEELETETQRIRKSYEEILVEQDSLSKSQVQLNHQVVKLKEELSVEKAECVNIKAQLTSANQSINEYKASLEKLSQVNEELKIESQSVQKCYEEILVERDSLSRSQVQLNHQILKLNEELSAEKAECVNIKAQLTSANQSVNEHKASLEKLSKVNEELETESQRIRKSYEEILVERDSLSGSQVQLNHQVVKLKEELSVEKDECVNIKAQLTSANQSINEYKASLEKLSQVNEELITESQSVQKCYEEILTERDSLLNSQMQLNESLLNLKEEHCAEKAECVNIKAQLVSANQSNSEYKVSLEKLSQVNDELITESQSVQKCYEEILTERDSLLNSQMQLNESLLKLKEEHCAEKAECVNINALLSSANQSNSEYKSSLEKLSQVNEELNAKCESLQENYEELLYRHENFSMSRVSFHQKNDDLNQMSVLVKQKSCSLSLSNSVGSLFDEVIETPQKWIEFKSLIHCIMKEVKDMIVLQKKEEQTGCVLENSKGKIEIDSLIKKIDDIEAQFTNSDNGHLLNDFNVESLFSKIPEICNDRVTKMDRHAMEFRLKDLQKKLEDESKASKSKILSLEVDKCQTIRKLEITTSENKELMANLQVKEKEIHNLLNTIEENASDLRAHRTEIQSMQTSLKELDRSRESQMLCYEVKLNELFYQLNDMKQFCDEHHKEYNLELRKTDDLFDELNLRAIEIDDLKKYYCNLSELNNKKEEEILDKLRKSVEDRENLKKMYEDSEENASKLKNEYENSMAKLKEDLKKQLEVNKSIKVHMSEIESANKLQLSELNRQIVDLSNTNKDLQNRHDVREKNYVANQNNLNSMKNSLNNFERQSQKILEETKAQNRALESKLSYMFKESLKKESEFNSLCDQYKSELKTLESMNSNLNLEIHKLKEVNLDMEKTREKHVSELRMIKEELLCKSEELNSVTSEFRTKWENKENEFTESMRLLEKKRSHIADLTNDLSQQVVENQSLKKSIDCLRDQGRTLDDQKAKICAYEKEVYNLKLSQEEDQRLHQREIESLDTKFKVETDLLNTKVYELNKRLELKVAELNEVKKKLSSLLDAKFSIAFENHRSSSSLQESKDNSKEISDVNSMINVLESERLQLKQELDLMKNANSEKREVLHQKTLVACTSVYESTKEEQTLGEIFGDEIIKMRNEMEIKSQNELAAQKARYESRIKVVAENITRQYKDKLEQCIKLKNAEIEEAKKVGSVRANEFEKKYNSAINKINELSNKLDETTSEFVALVKKYSATKNVILRLKEENETLTKKIENANPIDITKQSLEVEQLKSQLKKIKLENRQLSVQFSAAETKIKQLQKDLDASSDNLGKSIFKVPSLPHKDTPGRAKTGRTRSEIHIHSRRPPCGSGVLFNIDDEDGEAFSNSYLTESIDKSLSNDKDRLSELMRRNVLQPAHLKSSYPVETQFYDRNSFKESDLMEGKTERHLSVTLGPEQLCSNSSINNKPLRSHSVIGTYDSNVSSSPSPLSRKRQKSSFHRHSLHSNTYFIRDECDESPRNKDLKVCEVLSSSSTTNPSSSSTHSESDRNEEPRIGLSDETLSLPSVSSSTSSLPKSPIITKSLKSLLVHTPFKLKRAVRGAMKKKKSYNIQQKDHEEGDSAEQGSGRLTFSPLLASKKKSLSKKKLGKRK